MTGKNDGLVKSRKRGFMQICIARISTGSSPAFDGILTCYEAIKNACPTMKAINQTFLQEALI
jgi:hypothetical protein